MVGLRDRWRNPDGKGTTHPGCKQCGGYGDVLIEINDGGRQWDICPGYESELSKERKP